MICECVSLCQESNQGPIYVANVKNTAPHHILGRQEFFLLRGYDPFTPER